MNDFKEALRMHESGDKDAIENYLAHVSNEMFVLQIKLFKLECKQEAMKEAKEELMIK